MLNSTKIRGFFWTDLTSVTHTPQPVGTNIMAGSVLSAKLRGNAKSVKKPLQLFQRPEVWAHTLQSKEFWSWGKLWQFPIQKIACSKCKVIYTNFEIIF